MVIAIDWIWQAKSANKNYSRFFLRWPPFWAKQIGPEWGWSPKILVAKERFHPTYFCKVFNLCKALLVLVKSSEQSFCLEWRDSSVLIISRLISLRPSNRLKKIKVKCLSHYTYTCKPIKIMKISEKIKVAHPLSAMNLTEDYMYWMYDQIKYVHILQKH